MIRLMKKHELDRVMNIWLSSNLVAHDFVERDYWFSNQKSVKKHMQEANIQVLEDSGNIVAFIGLVDDYIAGIFIDPKVKSKGYGKRLIDKAKENHQTLTLDVYQKNEKALNFYLRNDFAIVKESRCEDTGNIEINMRWNNESKHI